MTPSTPPFATAATPGLMTPTQVTALANSVQLTGAQAIDGAKRGAQHVLTSSGAHIAIDLAVGNNFAHTTTENTTLDNPTNQAPGQHGAIVFTQGATARTMAFGSAWKFPGGTAPSLTAASGAVDVLSYYVAASGFIVASMLKDVK